MTSPFQSIIGTPERPQGRPRTPNDHKACADAIADEMLADENAANAVAAENPPFGLVELVGGLPSVREAKTAATSPPQQRQHLCGGMYTPADALALLNSHFFIGKNNQETVIFRVNDDGSATFMQPEQFKLAIQNIFVEYSDRPNKPVPAEKFWKESPHRRERVIVFKPGGTNDPREFNLWGGFGVEPRKGWQKQRRLLRHIREVLCRRDKEKFKYLIRYLAWSVQNPEKHAGVIVVLKSRKQGTGKSTLGVVMLTIFGPHGALVDDKERLLGRFTDWLETVCFVLAEEILFAGDPKATDKLKSLITADTIQIERKFGSLRQIPNRLKTLATTNHDHAVAAGVGDRRNVVYDVSDKRVGEKEWFDRLYQDLAAGGTSEFLDFLLRVQLADWHPREIIKTDETIEQQRMSGDTVSQWAQACIEADAVIGAPRGPHGSEITHELGKLISVKALHEAYRGFCNQSGRLHRLEIIGFGKACAEMFGPRIRLRATQPPETGRPWGYHVPMGKKWQEKLDARLGIKN